MTDLWEWAEQLKKIWGLERPDRYRKDPEAQKCNELVEQLKQRTVLQEEPRLIKEAIQLSNDIWLSAAPFMENGGRYGFLNLKKIFKG